jgi:hypothetical protein
MVIFKLKLKLENEERWQINKAQQPEHGDCGVIFALL